MSLTRSADAWEDVWAQYDAGQTGQSSAPPVAAPTAETPAPPPRRRARLGLLLALVMVPAAALASSLPPQASLAKLLLRQDVAGLMARLQLRLDQQALRGAMLAQAGQPTQAATPLRDADRYLADLAEAVALGWSDPVALQQVVQLRQRGADSFASPALAPLERVSGLRPTGWDSLQLQLGSDRAEGGFGLGLAWRDGAWQLVDVRLLDAPALGR